MDKQKPKFWKTIRPLNLAVKEKRPEIESVYLKMQELYSEFKAPDICFAISPIQTGGTTDKGLILIGTEIAAVNPKKVKISEIYYFTCTIFKYLTHKPSFPAFMSARNSIQSSF